MAEVATPSAEKMATARQPTPSNAGKDKPAPTTRPERPDEEQYKTELAKAEKELKSAEERMVRILVQNQAVPLSLTLLRLANTNTNMLTPPAENDQEQD